MISGNMLQAQVPNTMFFMPGVPQSHRINPAIQSGCGFYLGFPGLAPLRLDVQPGFAYSDIILPHPNYQDSLMTFLHPLADKQAFLDHLPDVTTTHIGAGVSLASLGFRVRKSFISFDYRLRTDGSIFFPKGMFDFLINGAPDGSTVSLSGLGIDVNVFTEAALGWSRRDFILPGLDIGVRGKALFGLGNISTTQSTLDLTTSMDVWNLDADVQFNAAAPEFVTFLEEFEDGPPVEVDSAYFDQNPIDIVRNTGFSMDQFGMAFDAGINYRPFRSLLISASVLDVGGINWKNTSEGSFNWQYDFEGVEVNPFSGIDTSIISQLKDTLATAISFAPGDPYFSKLNTKLFVGASFYPIDRIGFGLLSRTDFLSNDIIQQFTGTVNMTTGKVINLSLSYSYMLGGYDKIGAGLSLNLAGLNMYLISDNIVSGALRPLNAQEVSLWFGMNIAVGWKRYKMDKKAKPIDRPLLY